MIQTQTEKTREKKVRDQLEEITKEIVKIEDEFQAISRKIDKLPNSRLSQLKWLCQQKAAIFMQLQVKEKERQRLINLLNTIL